MVSDRDAALADIGRRFFKVVGETWLGMQLTKRSLSRIAGWSRQDMRDAAERSDRQARCCRLPRGARAHRSATRQQGHLVVIATSTGRDIVEPLADRLGVDRLIATDYEEDAEGVYTGNMIGKWLWGPDKADAVKAFAEREGVDLDESFAYSDSLFRPAPARERRLPARRQSGRDAPRVRRPQRLAGPRLQEPRRSAAYRARTVRSAATARASVDRAGEHRDRGRAAHPEERSRDRRCEPPLIPRPDRPHRCRHATRTQVPLPREERRCSTCRSSGRR